MAHKKANSSAKKTDVSTSHAATTTTVKTVTAPSAPERIRKGLNFKLKLPYASLGASMVAEFIGTFLLAAIIISAQGQPIVILFGLAGIVFAIGTISGAHVNPAMTLGALITRRINGMRAVGYIIAQLLGAMVALAVLSGFVNAAPETAGMSAQGMQAAASKPTLFMAEALPMHSEWYIVIAEMLGTAILGFALANAMSEKKDRVASSLTVGLGIFIALLIAGSLASIMKGSAILNPAIAMALQAIPMDLAKMWPAIGVYVVSTMIGGALGFLLHDFLRAQQPES